jgi:hypothetical protein
VSGNPLDTALFANGGELGREMSSLDWSQTGTGQGTTITFRLLPHDADVPEAPGARPGAPSGSGRLPSAVEGPVEGPIEGLAAWVANTGPAQVLTRTEDDGVRWVVTGELDLATVGSVRTALLARLAERPAGSRVDLDLG